MTHLRFRECLDLLELTQLACARLFHLGDRTVRRYADQRNLDKIPVPVAMALELMVVKKIKPAAAYRLATGEDFAG